MAYTVTAYSGDKITVGSVNSRNEFTTNVDAGMRGDTGYSGSLGYTGSVGAGYTGSIGAVGYTGSTGTVNTQFLDITTIVTKKDFTKATIYAFSNSQISHDSSLGTDVFIVYPTTDISLKMNNMNMPDESFATVKAMIYQTSNSAHIVNGIAIDDVSLIINWENGNPPVFSNNDINVIEFNVLKISGNGYIVTASGTTFRP